MTFGELRTMLNARIVRHGFNADARIDFYESIGTLLENGKSLQDALTTMHGSASDDGRRHGVPTAVIIADCLESMREGHTLSTALTPWIPAQECWLIAAGERAGELGLACHSACSTITDQRGLVSAVVSALAYPCVLLLALCGVLALIGYAIVPDLLKQGAVEHWRGTTHAMLVVGLSVQAVGPALVGLLIACLAGIGASLSRLTGRMRDCLDAWPPWSIYRVLLGTGFLMNIGTMLGAGVRLEDCMIVMLRHANPYMRERLDDTLRGIRAGLTLGNALHAAEHRFPNPRAVRYLMDLSGEQGFDQVVQRFARRELDRSVRDIARHSKVVGNMLTLLVAGACALFLLGTMGISQAARTTFGQ